MFEFVKCVALVAVVRSTEQGMVVIDPDGPTEAHRRPKLRSDVAAIMAADGQVKIIGETTPPSTVTAEDRAAAKAAEKAAADKAQAERAVAEDPPAKTDGTAAATNTAHPAGATDGMRDAGDGSPPLDDDGAGEGETDGGGAPTGTGTASPGADADKVPSPSAIKGMTTPQLLALAEHKGVSFDDTHDTNAKRADAIIAVLHPKA